MSERGCRRSFSVHAGCIRGVEAVPVTVEVYLGGGIPGITVIGLADQSIMDSRQRIRCALNAGGYDLPRRNVVVSLAPGDLRKTGSGFDLPILVAILAISGQIPVDGLDRCLFVGEMSLEGDVKAVRGTVAYAMLARQMGLDLVQGATDRGVPLEGVSQYQVSHVGFLREGIGMARTSLSEGWTFDTVRPPQPDFADVVGQELAKRAMAIAAAGELGMLMVGSPGSGKSMLAQRMNTILPPIDAVSQQEALCVHSVMGEDIEGLLLGERPFRSPHHSISSAGLVGGGRPVRPGEISLAHGGCLFLDELAEFPTTVLQLLRQPMEQGKISLVRAEGGFVLPARFQLIAASNPCPCGYLGDEKISCRCSAAAIERYRAKLGGPLIDRIDIMLDIRRPDAALIVEGAEGMSSDDLAQMVIRGRAFKAWRESQHADDAISMPVSRRGAIDGAVSSFDLDSDGEARLLEVARKTNLTGRGIKRVCRIARTIADMEEKQRVGPSHVLEANMYQGRRNDEI